MDRRRFLTTFLATTAALRSSSIFAQPQAATRGAIVIGVDKAGDLPKLKAASSGAKKVANWLENEGYVVKLFNDESAAVRVGDVFAAIDSFIKAGTFEQLVIYFAGHGFISGTLSEFWMLSGAPQNPNEAVSLTESCKYAEDSGIPNVVFISDACRSRADTLGTMRLQGGVIFPALQTPQLVSDVDQFLAARIGAAAFETSLAEGMAAEGIYTSCFLEAFRRPYVDMVQTVSGLQVVPNRKLKKYLDTEVPKKIQAVSIALNQRPDSKVLSDDSIYIARVASDERVGGPTPGVSLTDVARVEIGAAEHGPPISPMNMGAVRALRDSSGFGAARDVIVEARGLLTELPSRSGFTVSGQLVKSVTTRPGIETRIKHSTAAGSPSSLVEIDLGSVPSASVALRFADDTGTVLAALGDYVGNVVVDKSGVRNVSYVPSKNSPLRSYYEHEAERLEQLRASVATAAQFGVFRFDGSKETRTRAATAMADRIRVLKSIDPTLGVYAAYAYDDAGLRDKVKSVQYYLRDALHVDLYDVALLGRSENMNGFNPKFTPCCPMLSQGWGLLRVKNASLPESLAPARDHLRVSLWNSLDSDGIKIIEDALMSQWGAIR